MPPSSENFFLHAKGRSTLVVLSLLTASCLKTEKKEPVMALVNNRPILEAEVLRAAEVELAEIKRQEVAIKKRKLEELVSREVLAYEAKRLNQTEVQLFETFQQNLEGETLERAKARYLDELRRRSTIHIYLKDDGTLVEPL